MTSYRRYSEEKQQEQISRSQFKEYFETHGWVTGDIEPDLGEDILVRIYEQGISTGLSFYAQLKSVKNINEYTLKSGVISYKVEVTDLIHWDGQNPPVFIVIWDINQDKGWWLDVECYLPLLSNNKPRWKEQLTVNVHIPANNLLDENGLGIIRYTLADRFFPVVAKNKDITIELGFQFPHTPEGQEKYAGLKRHITAGDEIELDGKYIYQLNLPDWWERLYGPLDSKQMSFHLGPSSLRVKKPAQFDFFSHTLDSERVPYVDLTVIKQGQEEITLSNEEQNIPLKIKMIANGKTGENVLSFSGNFSNVDPIAALQLLKIQKILSKEGYVQFKFLDNGVSSTILIPSGFITPPDDDVVKFVENLCFIQTMTHTPIQFQKDGSFSQADLELANHLTTILKTGSIHKSIETLSIQVSKDVIDNIIKTHKQKDPIRFRISSSNSNVEILHTKIELGPMVQEITGKWGTFLEEALNWSRQAEKGDTLKVVLNDVFIKYSFERWKNRQINL